CGSVAMRDQRAMARPGATSEPTRLTADSQGGPYATAVYTATASARSLSDGNEPSTSWTSPSRPVPSTAATGRARRASSGRQIRTYRIRPRDGPRPRLPYSSDGTPASSSSATTPTSSAVGWRCSHRYVLATDPSVAAPSLTAYPVVRRPPGRPAAQPAATRRSVATSSSSRLSTMTTSPGSVSATSQGTATTTQPAPPALVTPVGESSIATHWAGGTPSRAAAVRYGAGCGLVCSTSSPHTTTSKLCAPIVASATSTRCRRVAVTSADGTPSARTAARSSRAPGRPINPPPNRYPYPDSNPPPLRLPPRPPPATP